MNLLDEVKKRMLISGNFHDNLLIGLIEDVKQYMISAGVNETIADSSKSVGCISKGVNDLFNNQAFSDFFKQRVIQLSMEEPTEEEDRVPLLPEDNTTGDDNTDNNDAIEGDGNDVSNN